MKTYNETIQAMEQAGWFRVHETTTHIFFVKRAADGSFMRTAVEYMR